MTLLGVLRQVDAAQRRAARAAERQHRLHARAMKLQAKANELDRAAAEAEAFEERIQQLTSIHHPVGESMDWAELSARPAPVEPRRLSRWEDSAVRARNEFKPGFFQRLFGRDEKVRAQLEQKIAEAQVKDEAIHRGALKLHQQQLGEWQALTQLASAIDRGETACYRNALDELQPLQELDEIGCELNISFRDAQTALVGLTVESEKVVPRESRTLMRSGKLSVKSIPQSKFNDLYQDYVCGCALRSARELFSFLPLTRVIVNVNATLLDSVTGHLRTQTILSVGMPRQTLQHIQFTAADPSDAMKLFPHRMGFKRSQGFFPINPLEAVEYPSA